MESIHATKDIGDHTIFGGSDVPPLGVVTEHQADLEKVGLPDIHWTKSCNI